MYYVVSCIGFRGGFEFQFFWDEIPLKFAPVVIRCIFICLVIWIQPHMKFQRMRRFRLLRPFNLFYQRLAIFFNANPYNNIFF